MEKRKSAGLGILLIIVGALALLRATGRPWLRMDTLWPLLLIVFGLWSAFEGLYRRPRKPDSVWFGVTAILCGVVFLNITLGSGEWGELEWQWPLFPLAAAAGWLAAWVTDLRQMSNLVACLVSGAVGVLGWLYEHDVLGAQQGRLIASWWPLILIVLGIGWIAQYLVQRR